MPLLFGKLMDLVAAQEPEEKKKENVAKEEHKNLFSHMSPFGRSTSPDDSKKDTVRIFDKDMSLSDVCLILGGCFVLGAAATVGRIYLLQTSGNFDFVFLGPPKKTLQAFILPIILDGTSTGGF